MLGLALEGASLVACAEVGPGGERSGSTFTLTRSGNSGSFGAPVARRITRFISTPTTSGWPSSISGSMLFDTNLDGKADRDVTGFVYRRRITLVIIHHEALSLGAHQYAITRKLDVPASNSCRVVTSSSDRRFVHEVRELGS